MNEAIDVMMNRRSVRSYKAEQIKPEQLEDILTAGEYAPSGRGKQAPLFVVVQNKELIDEISRLNAGVWGKEMDAFYGAPTLIIVFADTNVHTWVEDGSAAITNMANAAYSVGVDSCWIHRARQVFETEEGIALKKKWGVGDNYTGVGNLILGYKEGDYIKRLPRKENYVIYDK